MKTKVRNSCLLFLTACIWGSSFVAQSVGMDYIGPYTFNCLRFLIGSLVLLPVIFFSQHRKKDRSKDRTLQKKEMLCGGIVCGVVLCVASTTPDRDHLHDSRQGRLFDRNVYCFSTGSWSFPKKKSRIAIMD